MERIRRWSGLIIIAVIGCVGGGEDARAQEIKLAKVPGASTDAKYVEIPRDLEAAAAIGWFSSYVSRGQVNSDRPVIQPEVEIMKYGVYVNIWANFDLSDKVCGRRDFSEVDLTLGYKLSVESVEIRLGVSDYLYPNVATPETREVFVIVEYPNKIISPCLESYYDFDEAGGCYFFLTLEHEFAFLGDKLRLIPGVSSGWGSSTYNSFFFDSPSAALNDGNVYAELEYDIINNLTFAVSAAYMWLWDAAIRDGAGDMYMDTKHWTFGAKLAYEI